MIKEFRDFIMRGNVMDLAVAVIIGAAFSAIINSLVNDIIMPLVGVILGGIDFTELVVQVGSATIAYGNFIQAVINFLLVGLTLFLIIKAINTAEDRVARKKAQAVVEEPKPPAEDILLLTEIRDLLKQR
jgi:large conductance mechanosensitive channel